MSSSSSIHLCGTWPFCAEPMTNHGTKFSSSSSSSLSDLVVSIIEQVELNPNQATVGAPGSVPNKDGIYELDAAWMRTEISMDNTDERNNMTIEGESGAILALRGFNGAIRFARQVALESPHSILAGIGAKEFALNLIKNDSGHELIISPEGQAEKVDHADDKKQQEQTPRHQDTLGITAIRVVETLQSTKVEVIAAVSTSGLGKKQPGRIGDSPLFGSGIFSDCTVGAVTATGDGDAVSLFPISFVAVEEMKRLVAEAERCQDFSTSTLLPQGKNIVDAACEYAIKKFLESSNVRAFCNGRRRRGENNEEGEVVKNRLSEGGPLIGLCGVCYFYPHDESPHQVVVVQTGGACCKNWAYEYATSHLSFDEEKEDSTLEKAAVVRTY